MAKSKQVYSDNGVEVSKVPISVGDEITVKYSGLLVRSGAQQVYAHIGYGNEWKEKALLPMEREEDIFKATIKVNHEESLNIAFKDSVDNWDNNSQNNYSFDVAKRSSKSKTIDGDTTAQKQTKKATVKTELQSEAKKSTKSESKAPAKKAEAKIETKIETKSEPNNEPKESAKKIAAKKTDTVSTKASTKGSPKSQEAKSENKANTKSAKVKVEAKKAETTKDASKDTAKKTATKKGTKSTK